MFILIELGIIGLFLVTLFYILKKDKNEFYLFLLSFAYAIFFENINILLSLGKTGSYFYNENFALYIFHVPVFVVMSWSIIIYSSKKIAQNLPIKWFSVIFVAPLLVLLVDLSIDIVAIRLFYWYWIGYEFNEGFFGVPANNYLGWLFVSFTFYATYDFFKNKKINSFIKSIVILALSYAIFLFIFLTIDSINMYFNFDKSQQFITLSFFIIMFLSFIRIEKKAIKSELFPFVIRLPFYLFGLISIIAFKLYTENITILWISILFILFELLLFLLVWYNEHKQKGKIGNIKITKKNRLS
ncbi:MAG: carotenoid biosynthesis protein [Candidatus Aenigmatarchaeota archaeon]